MWISLLHTRIGQMRLLDANTANESSCLKKKLPTMFVLIYPFTSQIVCLSNDIMQRFTYNEKIEMTFYSIMASISHLEKMARTSAKSENPNTCSWIHETGRSFTDLQLSFVHTSPLKHFSFLHVVALGLDFISNTCNWTHQGQGFFLCWLTTISHWADSVQTPNVI